MIALENNQIGFALHVLSCTGEDDNGDTALMYAARANSSWRSSLRRIEAVRLPLI